MGDNIKTALKEALTSIQNGNASSAEQALVQANQTIWDPKIICNEPIGCDKTSTIRTDEADTVRNPLNEAINAIQGNGPQAAQQPIIQANASLQSLL